MLRNTHLAIGIASTLMVTQPKTSQDLALAIGFGSFGALISDIDVGNTDEYKKINALALITLTGLSIILALDHFRNTGIIQFICNNSFISNTFIGFLLLLVICVYGMQQPHRSFMHSVLALFLLSIALSYIYKPGIPYFVVGFLSHLFIDMFNKKKVQILYPLGSGISLNICYASGFGNSLALIIGCIVSAIELYIFAVH